MQRRTKPRAGLAIRGVLALTLLAAIGSAAMAQKGRGSHVKRPNPPSLEVVLTAERRLSELGYWTGPVDGKIDQAFGHSLIAFQKVEGRKTTGSISEDQLEALNSGQRVTSRETGYAHIEVDLKRQILFFVDANGTVSKILPISTGNGKLFTEDGWTRRAVTPTGRFKIQRKLAGWRKSPLGELYYPNYILGGVAIHGNPAVPSYPASHGCIRIPMFAAREFAEMTPIGTAVLVYE